MGAKLTAHSRPRLQAEARRPLSAVAVPVCNRAGPAFAAGGSGTSTDIADDGANCATYGPNWEWVGGKCRFRSFDITTEKNACCAKGNTLGTTHCDPAWCFGAGACDDQASVGNYCSTVIPGGPAPYAVSHEMFNTASYGPVDENGQEIIITSMDAAFAACNKDPKCLGVSAITGPNRTPNAYLTNDLSQTSAQKNVPASNGGPIYYDFYTKPAVPNLPDTSTLVTDPLCAATALRSPNVPWVSAAAEAYCTTGDNIATDSFCAQYATNAGKPAWADRAARAYCTAHPANTDFCACMNTAVPSPTCLDGNCTSRMGAGGAHTTALQDAQSGNCGSPTICQQLFDFQDVNCPNDPTVKSCINIANNAFTQSCTSSPPPCKNDRNCAKGQVCGANGVCASTAPPSPAPAPTPAPTPAPVDPAPTPAPVNPVAPPCGPCKCPLQTCGAAGVCAFNKQRAMAALLVIILATLLGWRIGRHFAVIMAKRRMKVETGSGNTAST